MSNWTADHAGDERQEDRGNVNTSQGRHCLDRSS